MSLASLIHYGIKDWKRFLRSEIRKDSNMALFYRFQAWNVRDYEMAAYIEKLEKREVIKHG